MMLTQNDALLTAMVTPFDTDGNFSEDLLENLIEHLLSHGTQGLVVSGTTGEAATLSHAERLNLINKSVASVAGRVPIIVGTGSNCTADTITYTQEVAALGGVDAALVVAPYYNKPNQAGLIAHFTAVADASPLPIILYNIPGRTGINIDAKTTIALANHPQIIGVKECAGLDQMNAIIAETPADFLVYSGEDSLNFATKASGATGVISVSSHILGDQMAQVYQLLDDDNWQAAADLHRTLLPTMTALFAQPSPAPVKALLNQLGVTVGGTRLPLVGLTAHQKTDLIATYHALKTSKEG